MLKPLLFPLLLLSLIILPFAANAQKTIIKGSVRDMKTGEAIIGASLYIDGSTIGVASNANGEFALTNFPEPPYKLTVSSIGYKTTIFEITKDLSSQIQLRLEPDALMLKEIKVEAIEGGWQKHGAFFLKSFIGYSDFAQKCKLLNPEDLVFIRYDRGLRVYADAPLRIEHRALGYEITYWLNNFEYDYGTQALFYSGSTLYKDLLPEERSKSKQKRWRENRQTAYNGSLQHFLRALYAGSSEAEGFEIRRLKKVPIEQFYDKKAKQKDTLFYSETGLADFQERLLASKADRNLADLQKANANRIIKTIRAWYEEPQAPKMLRFRWQESFSLSRPEGSYYEFYKDSLNPKMIRVLSYPIDYALEKQAKNGKIAVLNPKRVSPDSLLQNEANTAAKILKFKEYLHITYTKEREDPAYIGGNLAGKSRKPAAQISLLLLNEAKQVQIYANGHFNPPYGLLTEQYWAYEKMDKLLPLYFMPDVEAK